MISIIAKILGIIMVMIYSRKQLILLLCITSVIFFNLSKNTSLCCQNDWFKTLIKYLIFLLSIFLKTLKIFG